eukprot:9791532-Ditylum_brightwellii.AAC.1
MEYVQALEKWKHSVLEEVEIEEGKLKELFQDGIHLFFVSNGGEIDMLGYFGWAIGAHMDVL